MKVQKNPSKPKLIELIKLISFITKNFLTIPPIKPVRAIPKICIKNKGGKLKPEPIGFKPE